MKPSALSTFFLLLPFYTCLKYWVGGNSRSVAFINEQGCSKMLKLESRLCLQGRYVHAKRLEKKKGEAGMINLPLCHITVKEKIINLLRSPYKCWLLSSSTSMASTITNKMYNLPMEKKIRRWQDSFVTEWRYWAHTKWGSSELLIGESKYFTLGHPCHTPIVRCHWVFVSA